DRLQKSFDVLIAEVLELEQVADQPTCGRRDQDLVGFCELLQAGGEVRRVADQRKFAARSVPDQIADDDEAGRNADAHFQVRYALEGQFRNEPDTFQRSLDSALGAIFVRGGKSKIGQDAVAHIAGDSAVKSENCAFAGTLKCAHDVAQILGVEPARKLSRADHVAKDNGEIPPLCLDST